MMEQFRLPDTLSLQGNLTENWRRWKQQFDIYIVASGKIEKSNKVKGMQLPCTASTEGKMLTVTKNRHAYAS